MLVVLGLLLILVKVVSRVLFLSDLIAIHCVHSCCLFWVFRVGALMIGSGASVCRIWLAMLWGH